MPKNKLEKYYLKEDSDSESIRLKHMWFQDALQENSYIQYLYGSKLLEDGELTEGEEYLLKAIDSGSSLAAFLLADCYMFGEYGIEKNEDKALPLYIRACKGGKRGACVNTYKLLKKKYGRMGAADIIIDKIGYSFLLTMVFPVKSILSRLFPKALDNFSE